MIDCYSRRLAGWAIADHMRTSLVEDALKAAAATRGSLAGAVFHSDHGSVYTSKDYAHLCADLGVTQSMGAVGTSADNALAESFNATLKRDPARRELLARRDHLPPPGLPMANPLQHPPPALLVPLPIPARLRDRQRRYTPVSGVITPPCPRTGGKARDRLRHYAPVSRVITPRVQEPGARPRHVQRVNGAWGSSFMKRCVRSASRE